MNIVKAIERAFTPPGTGGAAAAAPVGVPPPAAPAAPAPAAAPPTPPIPPTSPPAPPQFSPGAAPAAKQKAAITGTSLLGAAAAAGQTAKKTLLGA
jgi:hypothetical protein